MYGISTVVELFTAAEEWNAEVMVGVRNISTVVSILVVVG